MYHPPLRLRPLTALVLLGFSACFAEIGDGTEPPPPPVVPPPVPPPPAVEEVPLGVPALAVTSSCAPRAPGERVVAVSPEGHLWLASGGPGLALRVIDGWSGSVLHFATPFAVLESAQAFDGETAALLADGGLWHFFAGDRHAINLPAPVGAGASLCGDPAERAFVLSGGALYQRAGEEWWQWTGLSPTLGAGARLLARDGECAGNGDLLWLVDGDLAFWTLSPAFLTNPALLAGGVAPALRAGQPLALKEGRLFLGPEPWAERTFAHGSAVHLAAAGLFAWVAAGDALLRFDGAAFTRPEYSLSGRTVEALHPYAAGGIWLEEAGQLCHLAPEQMVRIEGLRNGEETTAERYRVALHPRRPGGVLTARLDGVALTATPAADGLGVSGALDVGWHQLEVREGEALVRRVEVKRIPTTIRRFSTDVLPIYQEHCAGSACHSAGSSAGAPDLSRYEVWTARAARVDQRVLRTGDMPPLASRKPTWSETQRMIIAEWLNGGMRP